MSGQANKANVTSARAALLAVPVGHVLYPHAQLFAAAPAAEQAELLQAVVRLGNAGIRNLGALLAWEIVFAVARCAARQEVRDDAL